jgi:predicted nucleotidyltransferase
MKNRLQAYRQSRDDLLTRIVANLSRDERFVAAWLMGSYGRNDADEVSDIDLNLVVAEPYRAVLCRRQEQVSPQTTEERLALFLKFGEPALIHENNNNAPEKGTFTFVLYSGSAIMIDWILRPQWNVARPYQSLLLFDQGNIPVAAPPAPEDPEESKKTVAEQWAFFWMMTAITLKYMTRKDDVFVTQWLENLHKLVQEVERRIRLAPPAYQRGSLSQLRSTPEGQLESLRGLCTRMQELAPQVREFSGITPALPLTEIETLLGFVNH